MNEYNCTVHTTTHNKFSSEKMYIKQRITRHAAQDTVHELDYLTAAIHSKTQKDRKKISHVRYQIYTAVLFNYIIKTFKTLNGKKCK